MAATNGSTPPNPAVFGNADNFWRYSSTSGFDLSHPPDLSSAPVSPTVTIQTTSTPITIDPAKSALVIIDMQNFFLSPALGRAKGAGHAALKQLVENAIPACRKAGIRILWVNWGLTDQEVKEMPPAVKKAFGFDGAKGEPRDGIGSDMGMVEDTETGEKIQAGEMLMRDSWNAALCPPLQEMYEEGKQLESRPDVWIHKNRMSGMWGAGTDMEKFLEQEGLKTLFFTGVNTDQCVDGTYQDCFSKGYDCILLGDGAGTTSPEYAQKCWEYNAGHTWGFLTSCERLREGVEKSL